MRMKLSLGLAAGAVALALAPPAGAVTPVPGPVFTFSAETLLQNSDTAQLPAFTIGNSELMPNGTVIVITPSTGTQFTNFATNTYTNTPVFPANIAPNATASQNGGICNGLGNANTANTSATAITCVVNSATPFGFNTVGTGGSGVNVATQTLGGGGQPGATVFGATSIRLSGINGASPFAVSGLTALDNPTTLQTALSFGAGALPSAQLYVQVTTTGNGVVNGVVPNGVPVTSANPNGNLTLANGAGLNVTDPSPVAWAVIQARPLFTLGIAAATLRVDTSTNGLGTKFVNSGQPNNVSNAGFFGTVVVSEVPGLLNANNGLLINSNTSAYSTVGGSTTTPPPNAGGFNQQTNPALPAINPLALNSAQLAANQITTTAYSQGILQGNIALTITGSFPTIVNAFAVQNGNSASCNQSLVAGQNVVGSTISGSTITFQLPVPGTSPATNTLGGGSGATEYAICLITNGSGVILATAGPNTMVGPPNQMNTVNAVTIQGQATLANGTQFPLLPGNTAFSTIQYQGAAYYFENVFGSANLYPSFFRIINQGSAPITVTAIVTKDVLAPNSISTTATGGSSSFGTVAGTAAQGAPSATVAQLGPNDATYVTADQVAATVGQSLSAGTGKATVWLVSSSTAFRASMVAQSLATGDLINLQ